MPYISGNAVIAWRSGVVTRVDVKFIFLILFSWVCPHKKKNSPQSVLWESPPKQHVFTFKWQSPSGSLLIMMGAKKKAMWNPCRDEAGVNEWVNQKLSDKWCHPVDMAVRSENAYICQFQRHLSIYLSIYPSIYLSIYLSMCLVPTFSFLLFHMLSASLHEYDFFFFFYWWCLLNKHSGSDTQPFCGLPSILCLTRQVWDIHSPLRSGSWAKETVHRGWGR